MRFRLILLTIFALLLAYFFFGLVLPFPSPGARALGLALLLAAVGAILWVPLVFWQRDSDEASLTESLLLWTAFCSMGILSFVLVLLFARDLVSLVLPASLSLHTSRASLAIVSGALALFLAGNFHARRGVRLKRVTVALPGLPAELEGLRIVQITDLHVGPTIRRDYVERVVALANSAQPELVALTGDLIDGTVRQLASEVAPLARLSASLGKFYVPGNHEYYWEGGPWIEKLRELGFTPLLNEARALRRGGREFGVAGIPDPAALQFGAAGPDVARALGPLPAGAFPKILLAHQPRFAAEAERSGADLLLSGHTHGGQFFPWTLVAGLVHRHSAGLHRQGKLTIYVSRGTGYWGPPVRLGSPAEVTLLTLARQ